MGIFRRKKQADVAVGPATDRPERKRGRKKKKRGLFGPAVSLFLMIAAFYTFVMRRWHMKWGATGIETAQGMPGDDIIEEPLYMTTRAVTVHARPEQVWPWLAQMGEGRGGFYSYDWIERLMGTRVTSVEEILPEFQELKPGDVIPAGDEGIPVAEMEKNSHLVLGSAEEYSWGSSTWAIALYPVNGETRLVSRVRARPGRGRGSRLFYTMLEPGMFAMERKWLLGVKKRAESAIYAEEAEPHLGEPAGEQQAA